MQKKTKVEARTRSKRDKSRRQVVKSRAAKQYNPRMSQDDPESVPIADAARALGISVRTAKREGETGRLHSFRTGGGHWRVLKSDLEAFKQGIPNPTPGPASSVLQNRREGVEELRAELDKRKLERELKKLDTEDARAERERAEAARTQRLAAKAQLKELTLQAGRDAERRRAVDREEARAKWRRDWINGARKEFPAWLSVEQEQILLASVETELGLWGMGDSQDSVGHSLDRTIERVVAPWRAQREARAGRETLIQHATWGLPLGATEADKARAVASARAALSNVPLSASDAEVRLALDEALAPIKESIEKTQTRARRERLIEGAGRSLPWSATEADKAQATAAVRAALANLPLRASQTEEQTIISPAIALIRQAIEERAATQQQQAKRESQKKGLVSYGVLCVPTYIQELRDNDEIDSDASEDVDWIADLQDAVRRKIENEFDGTESYEDAKQVAREIVATELE